MLRIIEVSETDIIVAFERSDARRLALACFAAANVNEKISGGTIPDDGITVDYYVAVAAIFDLCMLASIALTDLEPLGGNPKPCFSALRAGHLWDNVFK